MNFVGDFVQTSRKDAFVKFKNCNVLWVGQAPVETGGDPKWHLFATTEGTSYSITVHETEERAHADMLALLDMM